MDVDDFGEGAEVISRRVKSIIIATDEQGKAVVFFSFGEYGEIFCLTRDVASYLVAGLQLYLKHAKREDHADGATGMTGDCEGEG